jgi:hypothetical protein
MRILFAGVGLQRTPKGVVALMMKCTSHRRNSILVVCLLITVGYSAGACGHGIQGTYVSNGYWTWTTGKIFEKMQVTFKSDGKYTLSWQEPGAIASKLVDKSVGGEYSVSGSTVIMTILGVRVDSQIIDNDTVQIMNLRFVRNGN